MAPRFVRPTPLLSALIALCFAGTSVFAGEVEDKWGPFRGRIVDLDTGEPIAGAVAIVVWLESMRGAGDEFYDTRAAITDASGHFEIARRRRPFFRSRITEPRFDYVAPGYVLWNRGEVWQRPGVALMRRRATLDARERSASSVGAADMIPFARQHDVLAVVNVQRWRLGLGPMRDLEGL
jgi:hypothetical protein